MLWRRRSSGEIEGSAGVDFQGGLLVFSQQLERRLDGDLWSLAVSPFGAPWTRLHCETQAGAGLAKLSQLFVPFPCVAATQDH